MFEGFLRLWRRWFPRPVEPVQGPAVAVTIIQPSPEPEVPRPRRPRRPKAAVADLVDLKLVLEQLPSCRKMLTKLRAVDPDAYAFHRRVGARIIDGEIPNELSARFLREQPAAGMVYCDPRWDDGDLIPSAFFYFTKMKRPEHVAAVPGLSDIYEVTSVMALHPERHRRTIRRIKSDVFLLQYHVAIIDGRVTVLKEMSSTEYRVGKGRRKGRFSRVDVDYPWSLRMWADECRHRLGLNLSPVDVGVEQFHIVANFFDQSTDGFQVRAELDGISVAFNVALRRTSYFFRDRDLSAVTPSGQRKRIFHFVAEHTRERGGKTSTVREHYRGLRRFEWKGNQVTITKPERSIRLFDVAARPVDDVETGMSWDDVGSLVIEKLEAAE